MHNPRTYLDSICPQDPRKEAPVAKTPKTVTVKVQPDMLAATEAVKTMIRDHLQLYSEWLDVAGLMKKPKKKDRRTHEDLVTEYLEA